MANKFVDLNGGNDANDGSTFALRKKTLSSAAAVAAAGDTIRVMGRPSTSSSSATWTKASALVTLAAAMNQLLYGDGAWTAAANVTATANTTAPTPKQGSNSSKLVCAAGFTTGMVAYWPTGAALNLSTYQQLTFWVQSSVALASGALSINLCSDVAGATIVNTLTLNKALNANQWTAVTIDNGAALGASIQSVRLTANSSLASTTISLDNISAAKSAASADCLTLNTLISPDNAVWYPVQSINGTAVYVDGQATTAATAAKGYRGATGSTTFYMMQPTVVSIGSGNTVYDQVFSGNGSSGSQITISGGWDPTAMTTQSGLTLIDRSDWSASGINLSGATGYITVDKFLFGHAAFPLGLLATGLGYNITNSGFAGTGSFSNMPTRAVTVAGSNFINCTGTTAILNIPATANYKSDNKNWSITNTKVWGAAVGGIKVPPFVAAAPATVTGCDCSGSTGLGFDVQSPCNFRSNTAEGNTLGGINFLSIQGQASYGLVARGNTVGEIILNDADVEIYGLDTNTSGGSAVPQIMVPSSAAGRAVVYSWTQYTGGSPAAVLTSLGSPGSGRTAGNTVNAQKEAGNAANNTTYSDYGSVTTTGVVGQPGSGIAWKLTPNTNALSGAPLSINVGKIACPANVPTTVKYWAKLSAAGPSARLRVPGGRYAGVGSAGTDVVSSAITGTSYAQVSVTFTPTESCIVDIFADVWGSTTQNLVVSGPVVVTQ
ncbi:MAG: hypothetical protein WC714_27990 [Candidatus Obscuribacterales bacterium]|jgi:hypothetical protein